MANIAHIVVAAQIIEFQHIIIIKLFKAAACNCYFINFKDCNEYHAVFAISCDIKFVIYNISQFEIKSALK